MPLRVARHSTRRARRPLSVKYPTSKEYRASVGRQYFSLPDSMIFYMAKNPSSAKMYQKMIKSCKYFFVKNPILVCHCLSFGGKKWNTCVNEKCYGRTETRKYRKFDMDIKKIESKIWVSRHLNVTSKDSTFATYLFSKLYQGKIEGLTLTGQIISMDDLLFLSQEINEIVLEKSYVLDRDGVKVPLEGIIATLPCLENLAVHRKNDPYDFTKTVAEFLKIPHINNLKTVFFDGLNETFDVGAFFEFVKKNKEIRTFLMFNGDFSAEYKAKLERIVDEILAAGSQKEYIPPFIKFDGIDAAKLIALYKLCMIDEIED